MARFFPDRSRCQFEARRASFRRADGDATSHDYLCWSSVVAPAQGRTTTLKLNYRNTLDELSAARAFATELLSARDAAEDDVPIIVPKKRRPPRCLPRTHPLRRPLAGMGLSRHPHPHPHPRRTGQRPCAARHGDPLPQQLRGRSRRTPPDPSLQAPIPKAVANSTAVKTASRSSACTPAKAWNSDWC